MAAHSRVHSHDRCLADCAAVWRCDKRMPSPQNSSRKAFIGFHVAFSFFGKKHKTPTKKKTAAGATETSGNQARKPAPPARTAVKPDAAPPADEDLFPDFSHYIPSPPQPRPRISEPPRQGKPAVPSQGTAAAGREPIHKPVAAVAPTVQEPPPVSIVGIEVTGSAADTAPVIEKAAILFANAQPLRALTVLNHAVRNGGLGASALQVWLMLFDLFQHLDMKAEFEELGMEFLVEFERSPPVWIEPEPQFDPALVTGGVGYCALTGVLSDRSASQFEQLRAIGEGQHAIRIDVAKLEGIDQAGCARLLEALEVLKSAGNEIGLTGEAQLLRLLDAHCRMGNTATDHVFWSLLFAILRRAGLKERFEEAAVNYAVTYEVSPPSWEIRTAAKPTPGGDTKETESAPAAFRLSGDVTGADEALPKRLCDWVVTNSPLVIDMSAVRRVDFASAGQLLNVFTKLHQAGVTVQIRGANALVAALFGVLGIDQVARIILNR